MKKSFLALSLSVILGTGSVAFSQDLVLGETLEERSIALGLDLKATGSESSAIGYSAEALGESSESSTAVGVNSNAGGDGATALGAYADASGAHSTALGVSSNASGINSMALGVDSNALGVGSMALGSNSKTKGDSAVSIGSEASASEYSVALGSNASASENRSTALGNSAKASGASSMALGNSAKASGASSMALGAEADASGFFSTALGLSSNASGINSMALGNSAKASGVNSIALGTSSKTGADLSVALGSNSTTSDDRVLVKVNKTEKVIEIKGIDDPNLSLLIEEYGLDGGLELISEVAVGGSVDGLNGLDISRKITGVFDGEISENSREAVNGSQLFKTNKNIADYFGGDAYVDNEGHLVAPEYILGSEKFDNVGESLNYLNNKISTENLFQVDGDQIVISDSEATNKLTTVNFGNRVVAGVANGKVEAGSTEAVNGGQLHEVQIQVEENSRSITHLNNTFNHYTYQTNARLNAIEKKVHENRKVSSAGISGAMAMSSIPYSMDSSKVSLGLGVASYDGESAFALGFQGSMTDRSKFRIQFSYDSQNRVGVGAGMAIEF